MSIIRRVYLPPVREKVKALRSRGYSLNEISYHLKLPKITVQGWVKNQSLSVQAKARIQERILNGGKKGRPLAILTNRLKKNKWKKKIQRQGYFIVENVPLTSEIGKLLCAAIYSCEGSKYPAARTLGFSNSDPALIQFFLYWLRRSFVVDEKKFRCQIMHRCDQNLDSLVIFWSKVTAIRPEQFYRSRPDPRTRGKPTRKESYRGVCYIQYLDAELQFTLQSISNALMEKYSG